MNTSTESLAASPEGVSRRTALRSAAWLAPAVGIAAASPAYATSQHREHCCDLNVTRSRDPKGGWWYYDVKVQCKKHRSKELDVRVNATAAPWVRGTQVYRATLAERHAAVTVTIADGRTQWSQSEVAR